MDVVLKGQPFSIVPLIGTDVGSRRSPSDGELADLTTAAWGKPGALIQRWLSLADMMVVASRGAACKGFIMAKLLRSDVLLYSAAVVHPDSRHAGLLGCMSTYLVWLAWVARTRSEAWRLWRIPRTLYLAFRTANPVVYGSVAKQLRLTPSPGGSPPTPEETEIATLVARAYGVEQSFDKRTFVIKGALAPFPELVYRPGQIPWCGDRAIDEYLGKTLELEQMKGNELVAVARARKASAFLYVAAKRLSGGGGHDGPVRPGASTHPAC